MMMNVFKNVPWVLILGVVCGVNEAREPIGAPAEMGSIPSPRVVAKQPPSPNRDLLQLVEEAIEISNRRFLVANEHSPWQIYHGLNALRREFLLELEGELVPAVDWLSGTNPQFRGKPWFEKTPYGGRAHRYTVPYHFEGHPNQSLALMVMCNLPRDHRFQIDGGYITVDDVINNAKVDLNPREELTWTLWFLTHYLESDETWMTRHGQMWSLEKLVQDQIQTEVSNAACGGTHNLYALSVARNNHLRKGGQLRGVWLQADQKVKRYIVAARSLQRRDGSFPTQYFRGYGYPKNFSEQIASTGHIMEWLMVGVDDRQFSEEWVERGIRYIAQKMVDHRHESAECGPLYHAVAALSLYRDRARGLPWPNPDGQPSETPIPRPVDLAAEMPLPERLPEPNTFPLPPEVAAEEAPVPPPVKVAERPAEEKPAEKKEESAVERSAMLPEIRPRELGSVSEQAAEGKLSVRIEETDEEEFELPVTKPAENKATTPSPRPQVRMPQQQPQQQPARRANNPRQGFFRR